MQKINRSVFRYIEFELYNYDHTKKTLEEEKEDVISSTVKLDTPLVKGAIGDSTGSKAMKLTTNTAILRMERTVRAIEHSLMMLEEEHNQVFELKYRQNKHWRYVASQMYISQDTYFKKRRELVEMVALQLGLKLEA